MMQIMICGRRYTWRPQRGNPPSCSTSLITEWNCHPATVGAIHRSMTPGDTTRIELLNCSPRRRSKTAAQSPRRVRPVGQNARVTSPTGPRVVRRSSRPEFFISSSNAQTLIVAASFGSRSGKNSRVPIRVGSETSPSSDLLRLPGWGSDMSWVPQLLDMGDSTRDVWSGWAVN